MDAVWWWIIGLALVVVELVVPSGFFLFILGVGMLVVGCVVWLGLATSAAWQVCLLSLVTLGVWYLFAGVFQRLLRRSEKGYGGMVGQVAVAKERIDVGSRGAGELWGSPWRMENVGSAPLESGSDCVVVSSDGLILQVRPKN